MVLPERIGLDTNIFVYYLEPTDPARQRFIESEVFGPMTRAERHAVTSTITLSELLVPHYREGRPDSAQEMAEALRLLRGLTIVPVTEEIATLAAEIRAGTGLRTMDAVQLASAVLHGASALLTNDRAMMRPSTPIPVLHLDSLVSQGGSSSS